MAAILLMLGAPAASMLIVSDHRDLGLQTVVVR